MLVARERVLRMMESFMMAVGSSGLWSEVRGEIGG